MNILIDFLSLMRKNGAAEYLRTIILELLHNQEEMESVRLYGVYDSRFGIAYEEMSLAEMEKKGIKMVDISTTTLVDIERNLNIDKFFIGCVQVLEAYHGLGDLKSNVIVVVHDLSFEETHREEMDLYFRAQNKSVSSLINWLLFHKKKCRQKACYILNTINLIKNNPKAEIIAVSEYTKSSILYAYNIPEERIHVLYSPERVYVDDSGGVNEDLVSLVRSGKRFMLLLGTQHPLKNTQRALHAFKRFVEDNPDYYLVTTGKTIEKAFPNHIPLSFLSDRDLQLAYKSCYALIYPTMFEGFGYPPVEVMRYGKPVITSNIGPVREVLAGAPIYFSPLYETDIFQALNLLIHADYHAMQEASQSRYGEIQTRQKNDLKTLLAMILS